MQPSPKHLPPTPSISSLARAHGVSRESVRKWKSEGVDLSDGKAVKARVASMQKPSASPDLMARKKEKLEVEIARLRHQLAIDQQRFVSAEIMQSTGRQVGQLVRQSLDRLCSELPPLLAGHDSAKIFQILKTEFRRVLLDVSERSAQSPIKLIDP